MAKENLKQPTKKLYIKTYGCQMNVYDSGKMEDILSDHNFVASDEVAGSDLVVLNTCHIREKAAEKVYSDLGRVRKEKLKMQAQGREMIVVVAGCVAQAEGQEIKKRAPHVDIVVGSQAYHRLPEMINNLHKANDNSKIELKFTPEEKFDNLQAIIGDDAARRSSSDFLSIQEGCDKFCTYCVVPYTRGAEFSRSVLDVTKEAKQLVARGVKDITLLGQNVNAFNGRGVDFKKSNLGRLIREIADIDGLERIRYMTSHPNDVDDDLISAHRDVEKLMPYLHLPVQSGSDRILKAMNRQHTIDSYRRVIDKFKQARADMAFSSDFIVGFPDETDADFKGTMDIVRDMGYAQTYSFIYSQRPGTPAALYEDNVADEVKKQRLYELQDLINETSRSFNNSMIGKTLPVLFNRKGKKPGQIVGASPYMQAVHLQVDDASQYMDKIVDVVIEKVTANSLTGIRHPAV